MTLSILSFVPSGLAQDVWDGGAAPDQSWATDGNWADDSAPGNPNPGTLWFGNNGLGTNVLDQDRVAGAVYYVNSTLGAGHTTDLGGHTLTISNGQLCAGSGTSNTAVTLRNGTLRLGGTGGPADLYAGWAKNNSTALTGVSLTISADINAVNLRKLAVTKTDEASWPGSQPGCVSVMDLTSATFSSDGEANTLKASGSLAVAGYGAQGTGTLKLPASVTNMMVGELLLGCSVNSLGILDLGMGSQLRVVSVGSRLVMGERGTGEILGLPTNGMRFTVGSAGAPAQMDLGIGRTTWATDSGPAGGRLALTNALFSAWLSSLRIGDRLSFESTLARGELDLAHSTLGTFSVAGDVHIGYSTSLRDNWTYRFGKGYLRLPEGVMTIGGNLFIGDVKSNDEGLVELHGTRMEIGQSVSILNYGDAKVWMNGASAGFDLAFSDTNRFTIAPGAAIEVKVETDPGAGAREYWCLRMAGDQQAYFHSLTNSGRVTVDMSGLSESYRSRFGVHYDGASTLLGLTDLTPGTLVLIQ